ncbi:hypothetical protein M2162_004037 [Streptomyces sp. SAI-041]|nr:hypothetical protein [Streptomyces sp. SAI-041]
MTASLPLALSHPVVRSGPGSWAVQCSSVCSAPSSTGPVKVPVFERSRVRTYTNWSSRTGIASLAIAAVAIRPRVPEALEARARGGCPSVVSVASRAPARAAETRGTSTAGRMSRRRTKGLPARLSSSMRCISTSLK